MEKINIAEILKDCPQGMELDCTTYNDVTFLRVDETQNRCYFKTGTADTFWTTCDGRLNYSHFAKCVIFPKGKTTWEGFVPPCKFKDGDILAYSINSTKSTIFIYRYDNPRWNTSYFVALSGCFSGNLLTDGTGALHSYHPDVRFATKEEKQKLFNAIKENGYRWNAEKKELERLIVPKFKVGDRIRHKVTNKGNVYEISKVYDDSYGLVDFTGMIYMKYQDDYELVPNKFDINTLKLFDKVLVRLYDTNLWKPATFGFFKDNHFYVSGGNVFPQCIPYEGNEHLLGTKNDCAEYYKTWE